MRITTRSRRRLDDMLHAQNAPWHGAEVARFVRRSRKCRRLPAARLGMFPHKTFARVFFRQLLAPIFLGAGATRLWR